MKNNFTAKGAKKEKKNKKGKIIKAILSGFLASVFLSCFSFALFASFAVKISFVPRGE